MVDLRFSRDNILKGQTLQDLERDVEEASARLAMAHKEIRRLTDELESAHLTQKAYGKSLHWSHIHTHEHTEIQIMLCVLEPELQEAQIEVEQLRYEVEKLKRCGIIYSPFLFLLHPIDNLSVELT